MTQETQSVLALGIVGLLLLGIGIGAFHQYWTERKLWNKGISPFNGKPWKSRDMDSGGGTLYSDGEHTVWLSWVGR